MKRLELEGKQFGRWTVQKFDQIKNGRAYWIVICSCGTIKSFTSGYLASGKTKSCGCLQKELTHNLYFEDLTDKTFTNLTILKFSHKINYKYKNGNSTNIFYWKCKCICGNIIITSGTALRNGDTRSCGCLQKELVSKRSKTHGFSIGTASQKRFFKIYLSMIQRCTNPNNPDYKDYGGRGIKVCDKWLESFENFIEDEWENYYKHELKYGIRDTSIDRWPDVNGNYEPENVRWATIEEQHRNMRTSAKTLDYDAYKIYHDRLMHFVNYILFRKSNKPLTKETTNKCLEIIGCSPEDLRQHIASQFKDGMSWDNHGHYRIKNPNVWEIEHIIPVKEFDLSTEQGQKDCFNYKNLRPWWGVDNRHKSASIANIS